MDSNGMCVFYHIFFVFAMCSLVYVFWFLVMVSTGIVGDERKTETQRKFNFLISAFDAFYLSFFLETVFFSLLWHAGVLIWEFVFFLVSLLRKWLRNFAPFTYRKAILIYWISAFYACHWRFIVEIIFAPEIEILKYVRIS